MTLGIISAMHDELTHLLQNSTPTVTKIGGVTFYRTSIEGSDAVLVVSGIGKTNAAFITTVLCHQFRCEKIVFSGVGGGIDSRLKIGDIVISTDAICVDYGRLQDDTYTVYQPGSDPTPDNTDTTHGYTIDPALKNSISIPSTKGLNPVQGHPPTIVWGKVLTADTFLACAHTRKKYWDTYQAQAYAMEDASIAQVCQRFHTAWVTVRAVSDLAGESASIAFEQFLNLTTYNAAVVTRHIIRCIGT